MRLVWLTLATLMALVWWTGLIYIGHRFYLFMS